MKAATVLGYLPRGNLLDDEAWRRRHTVVQTLLLLHVPALFLFGLWQQFPLLTVAYVVIPPAVMYLAGWLTMRHRRLASFFTTVGVVYCSAALVGLSRGSIEAHFHFFIIVGFIALYQDWVPFLWNIAFTVLSHGLGTVYKSNLIFNHPSAQLHPWEWSGIHGAAVLFACVGMVIFWRTSEDEQQKALALTKKLGEAEVARREFTSDLLVNLARRNQSLLYRQLDIITQLEESERDPDVLAWLFQLDHLATRVRRNAESLLVLSGEDPPRVWSKPVRLIEVVRAAIAETEDLSRVAFLVDDRPAVLGQVVADLTHLLAELTENAVRFSPPDTRVTIRSAPDPTSPGTCVVTVEDWGVGMRPEDLAAANERLTNPVDVDLATSRQLGLHVVARLAARHHIKVTLAATHGAGLTAVVALPPEVFSAPARHLGADGHPMLNPENARDFSPPMAAASVVGPPRAIRAAAAQPWEQATREPAWAQPGWPQPQVDVIDIRDVEPVLAEPLDVEPVPHPGYQQDHRTSGYEQPGYQPGYQQPGYQQPGYQQPGYQQPGYQQPGYQQPGYQQPGYQPGHQQPAPQPSGYQPYPEPGRADPAPFEARQDAGRYEPAPEQPRYDPRHDPNYDTRYDARYDARTEPPPYEPPAYPPQPQPDHQPEPSGPPAGIHLQPGFDQPRERAAEPQWRPDPDGNGWNGGNGTSADSGANGNGSNGNGSNGNGSTGNGANGANGNGSSGFGADRADAGSPLARRTPQAHLAPELRRRVTHEPTAAVPQPDAARARDALSRYQASRQAALRESGLHDTRDGRDGRDGGGGR